MEGYANENDCSLSVSLSPCSVFLPGCSSPVTGLDQADLFLCRTGLLFWENPVQGGLLQHQLLALPCQPLQLLVLFWWDMKVKLNGISRWGWKSKPAVLFVGFFFLLMLWHPWGKHSFASWYTVFPRDLFAKVFHQVAFGQSAVLC